MINFNETVFSFDPNTPTKDNCLSEKYLFIKIGISLGLFCPSPSKVIIV